MEKIQTQNIITKLENWAGMLGAVQHLDPTDVMIESWLEYMIRSLKNDIATAQKSWDNK